VIRLIQEVCRGRAGAGEPVDADASEQLIAVDSIFREIGGWVRPLLELLDDPGELANRRVVQRVGERLRPGSLNLQVALGIGLEVLLQAPHMVLFGGGETGDVDRDLVTKKDERCRVGVGVRANDMVRLGAGQHSGNPGPDISALGAVALVTETVHQLGEGSGNAWHGPARFAHGHGKPEAGDRWRHDVKGVTWVAAVGPGVRQRADDLDEFRNRTGIAMANDQRQRVGLR
jgi:hypothetical protein